MLGFFFSEEQGGIPRHVVALKQGLRALFFIYFLILLNHLKQKIHAGRAWIYKNKHKTKAASSFLFSLQRS